MALNKDLKAEEEENNIHPRLGKVSKKIKKKLVEFSTKGLTLPGL